MSRPLLIIGEVYVDFSLTLDKNESGIRLGGIVHAARGLNAIDAPYAVAAICPEYLRDLTEAFLKARGCTNFINLGSITGSPNIMMIRDIQEVGDQGYEDILCNEKSVILNNVKSDLDAYLDVLIFPGKYCLEEIYSLLPKNASVSFDIAYDIKEPNDLCKFDNIKTLLLSTSSELFSNIEKSGFDKLASEFGFLNPKEFILKENRGGSRIYNYEDKLTDSAPAILGRTKTSVGVGDVFSSTYVSLSKNNSLLALYKATIVSSAYAKAKDKDKMKEYIDLFFQLSDENIIDLKGTLLPWHERHDFPIYLAAPDFSYYDTRDIDIVVSALEYHNFLVRRPVKENGELPPNSTPSDLKEMYYNDIELINKCSILFAVPTGQDPGTLVEIGVAIQKGIPVIVFDPREECYNTMVVGGAACYSKSLDECLNSVFETLSDIRQRNS